MEQQSSQERNRIIDAGLVAGFLVAWRSWYSLQEFGLRDSVRFWPLACARLSEAGAKQELATK